MRRIVLICLVLILTARAFGLELERQKNAATIITFPLIDSTTTTALQSGATAPDSEIDTWSDGATPDGFVDCTNEVAEIGTTGIYSLSLTQAEMNVDYVIIQCKASDALTQVILIRTMVADPLLLATTDDGGAINVTGGKVDGVVLADTLTTYTGNTLQTGDSYDRLGAPVGASISADIAAVQSGTTAILIDTAAMDTANELRTLITGSTTAASTLTAAQIETAAEAAVKDQLLLATGTVSGAGTTYVYSTDLMPDWPLDGSWSGGTILVRGVNSYGAIVRNISSVTYSGGTYTINVAPAFPTTPSAGNDITVYPFNCSVYQTGDSFARLGAAGAGLTAVPWDAAWDAEVQSEVNDALIVLGLDHLIYASVAGTDVADNSVFAQLVSKSATADWDDYVNTTDSLQAQTDTYLVPILEDTGTTLNALIVSAESWLSDMVEDDAGVWRFTANALEQAPGGGGGGDATAANQTTIINHLTAIKGSGFVEGTDSLEAIRDRGDAAWGPGGAGSVVVDHDYGGTDALAYKTAGGVGIDNAKIYAYLKSDYDAGNYAPAYIVAITTTDVNGRWTSQMNLDPATYTLYYFKQGSYGPDTQEVTVE
jgi:hypothetical protein